MKPILFSGPMVRAILEGRKTQTRRVCAIKVPPDASKVFAWFADEWREGEDYASEGLYARGPWGLRFLGPAPYQPGDLLWVRETWAPNAGTAGGFLYRADHGDATSGFDRWDLTVGGIPTHHVSRWRPSIHMPKRAARLFLRVTDVRVERLQDITEEEAQAEGITRRGVWWDAGPNWEGDGVGETAREAFVHLWDSLNEDRGHGWDANPWVWVYTFGRTEQPSEAP